MNDLDFTTSVALRVSTPWRDRQLVEGSDVRMQGTTAFAPNHNSISVPKGDVQAVAAAIVYGAAKQAAPPRGVPR